jgi:hypothetical protein
MPPTAISAPGQHRFSCPAIAAASVSNMCRPMQRHEGLSPSGLDWDRPVALVAARVAPHLVRPGRRAAGVPAPRAGGPSNAPSRWLRGARWPAAPGWERARTRLAAADAAGGRARAARSRRPAKKVRVASAETVVNSFMVDCSLLTCDGSFVRRRGGWCWRGEGERGPDRLVFSQDRPVRSERVE